MRTRTLVLLATVMTLVPVWLAAAVGHRRAEPGDPGGAEAVRPIVADGSAVAVLHRWDRRRSRAWAAGDPHALARLYLAGSRTGRRDVADLGRWRARGLRVTGLAQQVAQVSVRRRTTGRLTLVVTERTIDGVAVGAAWRTAVPTSAWATHRVTLRRVRGSWRVVEARPQPAR